MKNFWQGFEKQAASRDETMMMLGDKARQEEKKHVVLKGMGGALLGGLLGSQVGIPLPGMIIGGAAGLKGRHENHKRTMARDILMMSDPEKQEKAIAKADPDRFWSRFSKSDLFKSKEKAMFGS